MRARVLLTEHNIGLVIDPRRLVEPQSEAWDVFMDVHMGAGGLASPQSTSGMVGFSRARLDSPLIQSLNKNTCSCAVQ